MGETVDLRDQLGILFTVSGIFDSDDEQMNNVILSDMEYVQDQNNQRGRANTFMVKLKPDARAEDVAAEMDALPLPTNTRSEPENAFVSGMLSDLSDMVALSRLVILITLIVVFVSVGNTVSMSVRDRTQQIGMLRTLGFKRFSITMMVVGEAGMVALIGGVVGAGVALAIINLYEIPLQGRLSNFAITLPSEVVLMGLGLAAGIGILGGILPAIRASRMKIVEALRRVD